MWEEPRVLPTQLPPSVIVEARRDSLSLSWAKEKGDAADGADPLAAILVPAKNFTPSGERQEPDRSSNKTFLQARRLLLPIIFMAQRVEIIWP